MAALMVMIKGGGLNTIEVPIPLEGETLMYHTITDPPLIEKEILRRNKRHFWQAENTPLAGKDVSDKLVLVQPHELQMQF